MARNRGIERFLQAAALGDGEAIKAALSEGIPVDSANEYGHTALMEAASGGRTDVVRLLLEAGANPRLENSLALDFAVRMGNADCVRLVLEAGADPNRSDLTAVRAADDSESEEEGLEANEPVDPPPLYDALIRGNREMIDALLAAGAHCDVVVNGTGLVAAAVHAKDARFVELMLNRGASTRGALRHAIEQNDSVLVDKLFDIGVDLEDADPFGKTPLALAAYYGRDKLIERLLAAGANIESKDNTGRTPLGEAVGEGRLAATRLLLKAGAQLVGDDHGNLVESALWRGNAKILRLLFEHGADPNLGSKGNLPPLFQAIETGKADVVEALLAGHADPNCRSKKRGRGSDESRLAPNATPLMMAARKGKAKLVGALLAAGADPKLLDEKGKSAADYAAKSGRTEIVAMLTAAGAIVTIDRGSQANAALRRALDDRDSSAALAALAAGADPDFADKDGKSMLTLAAQHGMIEVVRELVNAGAQANRVSKFGESALRAAALRPNAEIVRVLLAAGADVGRMHEPCSIPADEQNTVFTSYETALHDAAVWGSLEVVDLLLAAGADIDAVGTSGQSPVIAAANHRRMDSVERLLAAGAKVLPADEIWLAPYRFAHLAKAEAFSILAAEVAAACKAPGEPMPGLPGALAFRLTTQEIADDRPPPADQVEAGRRWGEAFARDYSALDQQVGAVLDQLANRARSMGFTLVDAGKPVGCGPMVQYLALLPTADKFTAMAAFGVRGNDQQLGTAEIVQWFRDLDREEPFQVRGLKYDVVEIEFDRLVADPDGLAKRAVEFCNDLTGGESDWSAIADSLRMSRRLHFWWD